MNEQLPYEHEIIQKLEALSLPDENAAWKDMRRRLDEEVDDDGVIVPPLKGCGLFVIIAIGLLLMGSLLFHNKIFKHKNISDKNYAAKQIEKQKSLNNNSFNKTGVVDSILKNYDTVNVFKNKVADDSDASQSNTHQQLKVIKNKSLLSRQHKSSSASNGKKIVENKNTVEKQKRKVAPDKIANKIVNNDTSAIEQNYSRHTDSSASFNDSNIVSTSQPDTIAKKITGQPKQDSSNNKKQTNETLKQHKISFGAGLTVHQQLPVAGQTFVPYNAEGRKGSLLDYIPSVFFTTYYKQKFFLQLNFRYGAPQFTKQLKLNVNTVFDTLFGVRTITTTSTTLKKTYYHQLPVSIHYNVIPQLSVGGGIIWNRFNSAVIQQDRNARNVDTNDTTFTSKILTIKKADSAFSATYLQAMIEADYKWKRFSLGMMYAKGLNPFIKFESPVNGFTKQTNSSLQIFLRYELWRSKKK